MSEVAPRARSAITYGEACDRGKVREENQDSVRRATVALGELFIVADGIGGYQGGATASRMVVEGFHTQLAARPADYSIEYALREACAHTNTAIHAAAQQGDASLQRMGSTVVLALLETGRDGTLQAVIGHVGDSRAYLVRNGQMRKVTADHSAVQALLSRNLLTEEEARNHPDASVLTRSLGHRPEVEIEVDEVLLQPGDALLLCSDGLWGYVAEADIAAVTTDGELSAQTVADTLLHQALAAGGQDNIGIEYIRVGGGGVSAAPLAFTVPESLASAGTGRARAWASARTSAWARAWTIAAAAVLLLACCDYLAYAARRHIWPFRAPDNFALKSVPPTKAVQSLPLPSVAPPAVLPSGTEKHIARAQPSIAANTQPIRPIGVPDPLMKKLLVVGSLAGGVGDHPSPASTIHWKHFQFTHASKPACAQRAEATPVVYAAPQVNMLELLAQHPELLLTIRTLTPRPIDGRIQHDCGSYDVIVILPRSGPAHDAVGR